MLTTAYEISILVKHFSVCVMSDLKCFFEAEVLLHTFDIAP